MIHGPALIWALALFSFLAALAGLVTERFQRTIMVLSAMCVVASVVAGIG